MISVVIPTYNHRDYILQTLDSVFAQTYSEYEVIVVNDGSPDDTAELLRPLARAGRIRYVEQENQGQGGARNRGIAEARGEYIALLDDDDLWPPDTLETRVRALRDRPDAVVAYGRYVVLYPDGSTSVADRDDYPSGQVLAEFLHTNWIISPGQALIRAEALRRIGGLDAGIWGSDDWDLYIRLAQQGEFVFLDGVALWYREHGSNASRGHAVRLARNHFKVMRKHAGADVCLMIRQLRQIQPYFVPKLREAARAAWREGRLAEAGVACAYEAVFRSGRVLIHLADSRRFARLAARVAKLPLLRPASKPTGHSGGPAGRRATAEASRYDE